MSQKMRMLMLYNEVRNKNLIICRWRIFLEDFGVDCEGIADCVFLREQQTLLRVCLLVLEGRIKKQFDLPSNTIRSLFWGNEQMKKSQHTFCSNVSMTSLRCSARTFLLGTLDAASMNLYWSANSI